LIIAPILVPIPTPMKMSPSWAMVKPRFSMKMIGNASNTGGISDSLSNGETKTRTAIHDAVDERKVDGDEHEDGLTREHPERTEERTVNNAAQGPVLLLMSRKQMLSTSGVSLALGLDLNSKLINLSSEARQEHKPS
jgi:hypothetical protein